MRIIAGSARGLKLNTLDGLKTRPTADRVKEALFSSLTERLCGASVLDAFSGSGALGIEALSRGAFKAVFCENDKDALGVCRKNLEKARLSDKGKVLFTDAVSYIKKDGEKFDIIFVDPPYASGLYGEFLAHAKKRLSPGGIIVLEYEEKNAPAISEDYWVIKKKRYGRVNLSYLMGVEQN